MKQDFDWNHARAFLVTADEGSLSGAARVLGQTQPTLGRQVTAFEEALGVSLFERIGRRLELTPTGRDLADQIRGMQTAAEHVSMIASGASQSIEGSVAITASDVFCHYELPRVLQALRKAAPALEIDVVADNDIRDLQRREADIALRNVRPEQPDLIAKRLKDRRGWLYASEAYVARHGAPESHQDLDGHDIVVNGDRERARAYLNDLGLSLDAANMPYASENGIVCWHYVTQGMGMTYMAEEIGDITPGVVRVATKDGPVVFPTWLTSHRELLSSARIRLVYDTMVRMLG